jgi:glucose-6-phosphate 1-epimerase
MKIAVREADWTRDGAALMALRRAVFIREQQVPEALEWDGRDAGAQHYLAELDGVPVGCARRLRSGQIGRMAVLPLYRRCGIGRALLDALLRDARGAHTFLYAQTQAVGFYQRAGFVPLDGVFPDAGIPHQKMEIFMSQNLETLNQAHALPGLLHFEEAAPGLAVAVIDTPQCRGRVAVQGAQVLSYVPAGQADLIWVSRAAVYQPGKGVRGGVPVCWPWFGALPGKPAHGFVRTRLWDVRGSARGAEDSVVLRLGLRDDESTHALWDHRFDVELVVEFGAALTLSLVTRNTGDTPMPLTQALHPSFSVGDITQCRVLGLENTEYLDKVADFAQFTQPSALEFTGETDRVYFNTPVDTVIDDPVAGRRIRIAKAGSASTVVWNPWVEKARGFADMDPSEYRDMLCVETCNASPDTLEIAPGSQHTLTAYITLD